MADAGVGGRPHLRSARLFVPAVVAITLVGLALRLAYVWFVRRHVDFGGDPWYYHEGANLLADGKGFINPYGYATHQSVQAADHPPLYLVYLAGFSLVGIRSITGHLLASSLLGAASIPVAALAGRQIGGPRVGIVAAVLVALYPNIWRYDGMLLSETLVIFLVLVAIWLAYRYLAGPSLWRIVALGAVTGLGALARSELLLLGPLLVMPLALAARSVPIATRLRWLAAGAAACVVAVTPWIGLNLARFDHLVLFTDNLGGTLVVANCDSAYYGPNTGYWDYFCGEQALERAGIGPYEFGGRADLSFRRDAFDYIASHKARVPTVVLARLGRITGTYRPWQQVHLDVYLENATSWVAQEGLVTYYLLAPLSIVGAVVLHRRGTRVYPLLAPIAVVLVTVALFYAATRFRAAAEPSLCLLAAVAVVAGLDALRRRAPLTGRGAASPPAGPDEQPDRAEPARPAGAPTS